MQALLFPSGNANPVTFYYFDTETTDNQIWSTDKSSFYKENYKVLTCNNDYFTKCKLDFYKITKLVRYN